MQRLRSARPRPLQRATLEVLQDAYPHLHNQSAEVVDRSLQDPSRTMQHLWHFFDTMVRGAHGSGGWRGGPTTTGQPFPCVRRAPADRA